MTHYNPKLFEYRFTPTSKNWLEKLSKDLCISDEITESMRQFFITNKLEINKQTYEIAVFDSDGGDDRVTVESADELLVCCCRRYFLENIHNYECTDCNKACCPYCFWGYGDDECSNIKHTSDEDENDI